MDCWTQFPESPPTRACMETFRFFSQSVQQSNFRCGQSDAVPHHAIAPFLVESFGFQVFVEPPSSDWEFPVGLAPLLEFRVQVSSACFAVGMNDTIVFNELLNA